MSRKTEITLLFRLLPLRHLATVGLRPTSNSAD